MHLIDLATDETCHIFASMVSVREIKFGFCRLYPSRGVTLCMSFTYHPLTLRAGERAFCLGPHFQPTGFALKRRAR